MKLESLRGREPFNGWSHLIASLLAMFGAVFLIKGAWDQGAMLPAKIFYAFTVVLAFGSSAAYHLSVTSTEKLRVLRNIDHIGIRALMIGTYAPLAVAMLPFGWNMLYLGVFSFLVFAGMRVDGESNRNLLSFSYITVASLPLIAVPFLWDQHWKDILWISFGSCFYSIGAFCYIRKVPEGNKHINFHGVWHVCVMLGSFVHFIVIHHLP
jgi:hemolysin III